MRKHYKVENNQDKRQSKSTKSYKNYMLSVINDDAWSRDTRKHTVYITNKTTYDSITNYVGLRVKLGFHLSYINRFGAG